MTLSLRPYQQGAKNWDKDRDWLGRCITNPHQLWAEKSSKWSLLTPPSKEALSPAIIALVRKGLQCCRVALLFHAQPGGMGMLIPLLLPGQEYNQPQKD